MRNYPARISFGIDEGIEYLHAAQEGFVQLLFTPSEIQRIDLINKVESEHLKMLQENA